MQFGDFDWDEGNRSKCLKHGVTAEEIESVFQSAMTLLPDETHSQAEQRFRAIGRSDAGRMVFLVFTMRERRGETLIRPISARYIHRKEIEHYAKSQA